jgi:hypothetical protein
MTTIDDDLDTSRAALQHLLDRALDDEHAAICRRRRIAAALLALNGEPTRTVDQVPGFAEVASAVLGPTRSPAHPQSSGDAPPAPTRASTPPHARTEGGAPEPRKPGRQFKYDYAEVAQVARQALDDKVPLGAALSAHIGCTKAMATKLVQSARKLGHDIPAAPTGARPTTAKRDPVPDVIETQAARQLVPPMGFDPAAPIVEDDPRYLDTTDVPADPPGYPDNVRFIGPGERDAPSVTQAAANLDLPNIEPGQAVHVCEDCGQPYERIAALSIHVHGDHHRPPTAAERRFTLWEGTDA